MALVGKGEITENQHKSSGNVGSVRIHVNGTNVVSKSLLPS